MSHPARPANQPAPTWVLWLVRVGLVLAILWAIVVTGSLIANIRTELWNLPPPGKAGVTSSSVTNWGQLTWAIAAGCAGLGLVWALVSSLRRRLRQRSWMAIVCLLLVLGMASWVSAEFVAPVA